MLLNAVRAVPTMAVMTMVEPTTERVLDEGTHVEVWNRFDRRWSRGFRIAESTAEGYRIRRDSDGSVLPHVFPPEEIRRERRGQWWY